MLHHCVSICQKQLTSFIESLCYFSSLCCLNPTIFCAHCSMWSHTFCELCFTTLSASLLKLHLRDIILLKVFNIFHHWAAIPLCEFDYILKPFLHMSKETPYTFISTKMVTKTPKCIPEI